MSLEEFKQKLGHIMNESGYQAYGTRDMPVKEQAWPSFSNPIAPPIEQQVVQDPNQTAIEMTPKSNVTSGETLPIDQPRSDIAQQNGEPTEEQIEVLGEVSSLLISIGFILHSNGLVDDKYNFDATLDFLQQTFAGLNPQQQADPNAQAPNAAVGVAQATNVAPVDNTQMYQESRKLLESRFKKKNVKASHTA